MNMIVKQERPYELHLGLIGDRHAIVMCLIIRKWLRREEGSIYRIVFTINFFLSFSNILTYY